MHFRFKTLLHNTELAGTVLTLIRKNKTLQRVFAFVFQCNETYSHFSILEVVRIPKLI